MRRFDRVVIVGVGQIGASLGLALSRKGMAREVIGVGRSRANLRLARKKGVISSFQIRQVPSSLSRDDLIVLATPVSTIRKMLRYLPRGPLIIDVGSTKETIVRTADRRHLRFVGTHPIAGTERGGAAAGDPDLFKGRFCLITPSQQTRRSDLVRIEQLWKGVGARVVRISPSRHDRLLASLSHLPHAAAYSLIATVEKLVERGNMDRFSLGGLKDTTRIAASPPEMWADIWTENRRNVLKTLRHFQRELTRLDRLIRSPGKKKLLRWLRDAQRARLRL